MWRREWDLNPRAPKRAGGFQDRCIKPDSAISPHLTRYAYYGSFIGDVLAIDGIEILTNYPTRSYLCIHISLNSPRGFMCLYTSF